MQGSSTAPSPPIVTPAALAPAADAVAPPVSPRGRDSNAVEVESTSRSSDVVTKRLERAIAGMGSNSRPLAERLAALLAKERETLDWRLVRSHSVVQLLLIGSITEVATSHYDRLALPHVESLLTTLSYSQQFAAEANKNAALRRAAQTSGALRLFVKQEVDSCQGLLQLLLRLYSEGATDRTKEQLAEGRLLALIEMLVAEMSEADKPENAQNPEAQLYAAAKVPVVQAALKGVAEFSPSQFSRNLPRIYPLLSDLIVIGTRDQRVVVRELFVRLGGAMLAHPVATM